VRKKNENRKNGKNVVKPEKWRYLGVLFFLVLFVGGYVDVKNDKE
jgi:hypothetical protein